MGWPRPAELRNAFPPPTAALLRRIGIQAERQGAEAYLVGGILRDAVLGIRNIDLDIAVVGDGLGFARSLGKILGANVKLHERFLTAKLEFPRGRTLDVATARREVYDRPGALPRVMPASLAEDLGRRDISINAIAMGLNPGSLGEIHDPYDGVGDIERRIIRILHAGSLRDDPTRMVRMARFAARFEFRLEPETEKRLGEALSSGAFEHISPNRRRHELDLALSESRPGKVLALLGEWGILKALLPGVRVGLGCGGAIERAARLLKLAALRDRVEPGMLRLAILLSGTTRLSARRAISRLGLEGRIGMELEQAWRARFLLKRLAGAKSPSDIHRILAKEPPTIQLAVLAKARAGPARRRLERYVSRLWPRRPSLSGDDLRRMGCPPGPRIKELLDRLLAREMDGKLKGRRAAERFVRNCGGLGRKFPPRRRVRGTRGKG